MKSVISKKNISALLCVFGIILILLGIYQIICPSFQNSKESYEECMVIYEEAKLNTLGSKYEDLRYLSSSLASDMYRMAMGEKQKMNNRIVKCVVLCLLGGASESTAIYLTKRTE